MSRKKTLITIIVIKNTKYRRNWKHQEWEKKEVLTMDIGQNIGEGFKADEGSLVEASINKTKDNNEVKILEWGFDKRYVTNEKQKRQNK